MNRTVEIILTSIGLALSLMGFASFVFLLFFSFSDLFRLGFLESDISTNPIERDALVTFIIGLAWVILAVSFISAALGALAIYFYIDNKKPRAASIMMIITAGITIFIGNAPALFYLAAGITGLVRKEPTDPQTIEQTS